MLKNISIKKLKRQSVKIKINNFKKFNPRNDLKSMPWIRLQNDFYDKECFWFFFRFKAVNCRQNNNTWPVSMSQNKFICFPAFYCTLKWVSLYLSGFRIQWLFFSNRSPAATCAEKWLENGNHHFCCRCISRVIFMKRQRQN